MGLKKRAVILVPCSIEDSAYKFSTVPRRAVLRSFELVRMLTHDVYDHHPIIIGAIHIVA
jgi:hypothetical protein